MSKKLEPSWSKMTCSSCMQTRDSAVGCWDTFHIQAAPTLSPSQGKDEGREVTIDVLADYWKQIQQAAQESKWIPKEYVIGDWVSDVCEFLRDGPASLASVPSQGNAAGFTTFGVGPSQEGKHDLLIEAEALLCDERGGPAANELAARIRTALRSRTVSAEGPENVHRLTLSSWLAVKGPQCQEVFVHASHYDNALRAGGRLSEVDQDAARYRCIRKFITPRILSDQLGMKWVDIPEEQTIAQKIDELVDAQIAHVATLDSLRNKQV